MVPAQLRDFRRDHRGAVRRFGIARVVLRVLLFGRIEGRERRELRDDRGVPHAFLRQVGDLVLGCFALRRRVVEDFRPVPLADVAALTVERRRIVDREEDVEQVGDFTCAGSNVTWTTSAWPVSPPQTARYDDS